MLRGDAKIGINHQHEQPPVAAAFGAPVPAASDPDPSLLKETL